MIIYWHRYATRRGKFNQTNACGQTITYQEAWQSYSKCGLPDDMLAGMDNMWWRFLRNLVCPLRRPKILVSVPGWAASPCFPITFRPCFNVLAGGQLAHVHLTPPICSVWSHRRLANRLHEKQGWNTLQARNKGSGNKDYTRHFRRGAKNISQGLNRPVWVNTYTLTPAHIC